MNRDASSRFESLDDPPELTAFRRDLVIDGRSPFTAHNYVSAMRRLIAFHNGIALKALTPEHVRAFLAHLTTTTLPNGQKRQPSTRFNALKGARAFSRWATEQGVVPQDFTAGIKGPKPKDRVMEPPTPEAVAKILDAASRYGRTPMFTLRNTALVTLAFDTGCRIQELLNLNVADVWDGNVRDTVLVRTLKSGYDRILSINPEPREALGAYLVARVDLAPDRPLFVGLDWGRMTYPAARRVMQDLSAAAGIKVNWHDARRAVATTLRLGGANETDLMVIGGWRSLAMVRRYSHAAAAISAMKVHRTFSPLATIRKAATGTGAA